MNSRERMRPQGRAAIEQAVTEGNAGHPLDILATPNLRIFHYAKSLEEIDQMDYGRLSFGA